MYLTTTTKRSSINQMSYRDLALRRVPLLSLLICLAVSPPAAASGSDSLQQLRHATQLQPSNPVHHIQLAVALHELNHQVPDGGSRVSEAEHEYRCVQILSLALFTSELKSTMEWHYPHM